jgi:hypothetical protein
MIDYDLIDPEAPPAENVGAVLAYLDEAEAERARERRHAEALCERERRRIARGAPSVAVLHAVERGVAPGWVTDDLRRSLAVA